MRASWFLLSRFDTGHNKCRKVEGEHRTSVYTEVKVLLKMSTEKTTAYTTSMADSPRVQILSLRYVEKPMFGLHVAETLY